jgi:hypothetical protein
MNDEKPFPTHFKTIPQVASFLGTSPQQLRFLRDRTANFPAREPDGWPVQKIAACSIISRVQKAAKADEIDPDDAALITDFCEQVLEGES